MEMLIGVPGSDTILSELLKKEEKTNILAGTADKEKMEKKILPKPRQVIVSTVFN